MSQPTQPNTDYADFLAFVSEKTARKPRTPKKAKASPANVSPAVKLLNDLADRRKQENHPNSRYGTKANYNDDSTNGLTDCVMKWLDLNGHCPARINTTGLYDTKLGKYRPSGSTVGVPDILACIESRYVGLEIKFGSDKLRPEQIAFGNKIRESKGVYVEVRTFDQFMSWYNDFTRLPFE